MIIVTDIGGTYTRLAKVIDGKPQDTVKYNSAEFADFQSILEQYCIDQSVLQIDEILIAAAGAPNGDRWIITNNPNWPIDLTVIKNSGITPSILLNDFEAGTYALPVLEQNDLKVLKAGKKTDQSLCLLGAGTGLGLGYFHPPATVQKTHGGHMPIAAVTDEQWDAVKTFHDKKGRPVVFEDFVSGQNDLAKTHPRLFHEFLGLFAAQSVIHGHAYGGLYLTGGVIEGLMSEGKFDFDTFDQWFCIDAVPCVKEDLQHTPIYYITDPYPALKGLTHAKSLSDN